jgi:hypothetical protein
MTSTTLCDDCASPRHPPGHAHRDAAKRRTFDTISQLTGKGRAFRGLHALGLPIYCDQALSFMT